MTTEATSPAPAASVTVRAPATSANLGPGFDSFGLALHLYDTVEATTLATGLQIVVSGEGESDVPRDERNLIVRALRATLHRLGVPQPGLRLVCRNAVPQARGLGSSAAAIVTGIRLGEALAAGPRLAAGQDLELATALEGHPDNVAACLLGGFTIAWSGGQEPTSGVTSDSTRRVFADRHVGVVRLDVHPHVQPVLFVPPNGLSTAEARTALPVDVPHADASRTAGRAGLLVAALTAHPEHLFEATKEWLHQGYRRRLMPQSLELLDRLRDAGIPAVVSGAGPSVLAFGLSTGRAQPSRWATPGWRTLDVRVDSSGAHIEAISGPGIAASGEALKLLRDSSRQ